MMKRTVILLSFLLCHLWPSQAQLQMFFSADSLSSITSPLDLDSLFYWFAADVGVTTNNNKVTQWNDLSGNGHHVTQADTSKAPTFEATGGPGSKPTMTFDGMNDFLASAAHWWGSDDITVCVVMKFANATRDATEVIISKQEGIGNNRQWQMFGYNAANSYIDQFWVYNTGTSADDVRITDGVKSTSFKIKVITSNGSGAFTWNNNGSNVFNSSQISGTGDGSIYNSAIPKFAVGANNVINSPGSFLQGSISEIIVYSRALSATERTAIENYLNRKYDLY